MRMHSFDVQPGIINDRAATLNNSRDQDAIFLGQEFGSVEAHITQPLHYNSFAIQTAFQTGALHIIRMPKKFTQPKLHPAPRGFSTSMNAAVLHRLASHAAETIDILRVQLPIFIAIQAISRPPVPISGAGTFRPGLTRLRLFNSCVKRRVIFSNSSSV